MLHEAIVFQLPFAALLNEAAKAVEAESRKKRTSVFFVNPANEKIGEKTNKAKVPVPAGTGFLWLTLQGGRVSDSAEAIARFPIFNFLS